MISCRRGFTLIELLFVVATIAVLAAIAVPNFLEAQTRSKLARTKTDLSVISMALSRYYADQGAYPPNGREPRRYLDAALEHPIMNDKHASQPADASIGWYGEEDPAGPDADYYNHSYQRDDFPALRANGRQLNLLTSPVAYLESNVPLDPFNKRRFGDLFYLNSYELFADDNATSHPGLWGDHLTSATYTMIGSVGPNGGASFWHPVSGPWIIYDPTNGTVSKGDLLQFEGRQPRYVEPDPHLNPDEQSDPLAAVY